MNAEITHGDLLPCLCGAGKPDVTELLGFLKVMISCDNCCEYVHDKDEGKAVSSWNFQISYELRRRDNELMRCARLAGGVA
jgi:hypothetical protein